MIEICLIVKIIQITIKLFKNETHFINGSDTIINGSDTK